MVELSPMLLRKLNPGLNSAARQNSLNESQKLSESSPCIGKAGLFIGCDANRERSSGYSVKGKLGHL